MKGMLQEKKIEAYFKYIPYITLLLIFIFIWKINTLTPLWADDYCRVGAGTSLTDAFQTAFSRYWTWSGRFFVMVINYLVFGNYPASMGLFNLINSIFFVLLNYIIFLIAFNRRPTGLRDGLYILLIFNLLLIGTRGIGEVIFWKTGSIGYLWGVTLELIVLAPFFKIFRGEFQWPTNKYFIYGFYLISLVASTFLEHLSLAVSVALLYITVESILKKSKIPRFLIISATIHLFGTAVLILSKGNFVRAILEQVRPLSQRIVENINLYYLQGSLGWILVLLFMIALTNKSFVNNIKKSILWVIFPVAIISMVAFSFSPTEQLFNFRRAYPFEIFLILGIAHLSGFIPKIRLFEISVALLLLALSFGHGATLYRNSVDVSKQIVERTSIISSSLQNGKLSLQFPKITTGIAPFYEGSEYIQKYLYISDITEDASHWKNTCFAQAFGLKEVTSSQ